MRRMVWFLVAACLGSFSWVQAADVFDFGAEQAGVIRITAERMELDNRRRAAKFVENVVVRYGETRLYAQEGVAEFGPDKKRISKITARGKVRVERQDLTITAEEGVYYDAERKIVLTGNPLCRQGENTLAGEKIVYFLDEDRVVVEKAQTVLHPKPRKRKGVQVK